MLGRLSLFALLVGSLLFGVLLAQKSSHAGTSVHFLSVGQGDCTVILHEDWVVVVDTGPRRDGYDAGDRIVVPALRKLGVTKIDVIVLTHPDADHAGGLSALAHRFDIGRVLVAAHFSSDEKMLSIIEQSGLPAGKFVFVSGHSWTELGDLRLDLYSPNITRSTSANDASMFVMAGVEGAAVLLTGDAGQEVEQGAIAAGIDWDVDLLQAGHHGSKGATSRLWLAATTPEHVVFSAGRNNVYGHPHPSALLRATQSGAKVWRTDSVGTVSFRLKDGHFVRVTNF